MRLFIPLVSLFSAIILSPQAIAHPGHADAGGFLAGLWHPLLGLDHLLAALAVGLWAAQQRGALRWGLPLGFVAATAAGALLTLGTWMLPLAEAGILASLLLSGSLIALGRRLPATAVLGLGLGSALCHGAAHGSAVAAATFPMATLAGLLTMTAALHGAGYFAARRLLSPSATRLGGVLTLGTGLLLLTG